MAAHSSGHEGAEALQWDQPVHAEFLAFAQYQIPTHHEIERMSFAEQEHALVRTRAALHSFYGIRDKIQHAPPNGPYDAYRSAIRLDGEGLATEGPAAPPTPHHEGSTTPQTPRHDMADDSAASSSAAAAAASSSSSAAAAM